MNDSEWSGTVESWTEREAGGCEGRDNVQRRREHGFPLCGLGAGTGADSLYETPSQLHHWLRQYKDGPTAEVRERLGTHVAATLARFIHGHLDCIAGAVGHEPTLATTVPSSGRRQGRHPLEIAVERLLRLRPIYRPALGWTGAVQLDHSLAGDGAYEPTFGVEAHHVLLIDDTLTSAARVVSAASTLLGAGAATVAVVVIGRVIKPNWNENCSRIWEAARATEFDFDVRCLET